MSLNPIGHAHIIPRRDGTTFHLIGPYSRCFAIWFSSWS